MYINRNYIVIGCLLGILVGCNNLENTQHRQLRRKNVVVEPIVRPSDVQLEIQHPTYTPRKPYPWEHTLSGSHLRVTKEYFRCRGSARHPPKSVEGQRLFDCSGSHSLPLRDNKEFIWPRLISILNEIQAKTNKRVVITCGHRCPTHNTYSDPSRYNQASKHQIGAEVDFYVEGMENEPEKVVQLIMDQFPHETFVRYEKGGLNVAIQPWFNKEIFIKLYQSHEGRDLDNNHPYPYISIQMRYDPETKEWVTYSWEKAFKHYLRE